VKHKKLMHPQGQVQLRRLTVYLIRVHSLACGSKAAEFPSSGWKSIAHRG